MAALYDEYSPDWMSAIFREMYNVPEYVPVFDRVAPFLSLPPKRDTGRELNCAYIRNMAHRLHWVHVVGTPETFTRDVEQDLSFEFPDGYNNLVDVVPNLLEAGGKLQKKYLTYVHYRLCAPGLPTDF